MAEKILWFLIGMNGVVIIVNLVNLARIDRLNRKTRRNLDASEDILNGLKFAQNESEENTSHTGRCEAS